MGQPKPLVMQHSAHWKS